VIRKEEEPKSIALWLL